MARQHTSNIVWLVDDEKDGLDTGATIQKIHRSKIQYRIDQ